MSRPEFSITGSSFDNLVIEPPVILNNELLDYIIIEVIKALSEVLERVIEEKLTSSDR
jgi:hypothetical protein